MGHGLARYQGEADPLVGATRVRFISCRGARVGAASPRYTAPLAVFTVLRSSAEIEFGVVLIGTEGISPCEDLGCSA